MGNLFSRRKDVWLHILTATSLHPATAQVPTNQHLATAQVPTNQHLVTAQVPTNQHLVTAQVPTSLHPVTVRILINQQTATAQQALKPSTSDIYNVASNITTTTLSAASNTVKSYPGTVSLGQSKLGPGFTLSTYAPTKVGSAINGVAKAAGPVAVAGGLAIDLYGDAKKYGVGTDNFKKAATATPYPAVVGVGLAVAGGIGIGWAVGKASSAIKNYVTR